PSHESREPGWRPALEANPHKRPGQSESQQADRAQIEKSRPALDGPPDPFSSRWPIVQLGFQLAPSRIDEEVTDMSAAHVRRLFAIGCTRVFDGRPGDLNLVDGAATGEGFDDVPVLVPARKIKTSVNAGRVLAQHPLDEADTLEEHLPVETAQQLHAGDNV